jgi:hypothetical protein
MYKAFSISKIVFFLESHFHFVECSVERGVVAAMNGMAIQENAACEKKLMK